MILQQNKIVFGGTTGAGKSQAMKVLSDIPVIETQAVHTDRQAHTQHLTTVGIDYGEIVLEDKTPIGLYGTPEQDHFNFMWSLVGKGTIGIVILIDHSRKERLQDLEFYLKTLQAYGAHLVIGITQLDQQEDHKLKIYRDLMKEYQCSYPLFEIDTQEKNDVLLMIEALITSIEMQHL